MEDVSSTYKNFPTVKDEWEEAHRILATRESDKTIPRIPHKASDLPVHEVIQDSANPGQRKMMRLYDFTFLPSKKSRILKLLISLHAAGCPPSLQMTRQLRELQLRTIGEPTRLPQRLSLKAEGESSARKGSCNNNLSEGHPTDSTVVENTTPSESLPKDTSPDSQLEGSAEKTILPGGASNTVDPMEKSELVETPAEMSREVTGVASVSELSKRLTSETPHKTAPVHNPARISFPPEVKYGVTVVDPQTALAHLPCPFQTKKPPVEEIILSEDEENANTVANSSGTKTRRAQRKKKGGAEKSVNTGGENKGKRILIRVEEAPDHATTTANIRATLPERTKLTFSPKFCRIIEILRGCEDWSGAASLIRVQLNSLASKKDYTELNAEELDQLEKKWALLHEDLALCIFKIEGNTVHSGERKNPLKRKGKFEENFIPKRREEVAGDWIEQTGYEGDDLGEKNRKGVEVADQEIDQMSGIQTEDLVEESGKMSEHLGDDEMEGFPTATEDSVLVNDLFHLLESTEDEENRTNQTNSTREECEEKDQAYLFGDDKIQELNVVACPGVDRIKIGEMGQPLIYSEIYAGYQDLKINVLRMEMGSSFPMLRAIKWAKKRGKMEICTAEITPHLSDDKKICVIELEQRFFRMNFKKRSFVCNTCEGVVLRPLDLGLMIPNVMQQTSVLHSGVHAEWCSSEEVGSDELPLLLTGRTLKRETGE